MLDVSLSSTKQYGDLSSSLCAFYFIAQGYQVLIPYGDRGHYDLVVEKDNHFSRVQCKWVSHKVEHGYYRVSLRVCGSSVKDGKITKVVTHKYCADDFDTLWVTTPESSYCIPINVFLNSDKNGSNLKLTPKYDIYRVPIPIPFPDDESSVKRLSPRLTDEDKSTVKRLLKEGKTQGDIAKILGVTRSCIANLINRGKV